MNLFDSTTGVLPDHLLERELKDLKVGESAWTVPWAMYVTEDRRCWLHGGYSAFDQQGGTVQMIVTHTKDGYIVDVSYCRDHGWHITNGSGYMGDFTPIPVVRLIGITNLKSGTKAEAE